MLAYIAPIFVFGLVVFVHELGHFLAAKAVGVYTPRFSIGFGKALWKRRFGETEYVLAMLPIGGYVRMASRDDEATAFLEGGSENAVTEVATHGQPADPDAMMPFGPKPIPPDRWFESKPLWARLMVLLAGVTMNIVLALVVTTGMFVHYGSPYLSTTADSLFAGRPAAIAGIQHGDSIVAINGESVDWEKLVAKVSASPGVPLAFDVVRGGERMRLSVTPAVDTAMNPSTGRVERVGRIGILPVQISRPVGLGEAVTSGWRVTWRMAGTVIEALRGLATRKVSASELGGPIMIAQASVQAARGGLEQLFFLIALISTNLAVFNLLPIPILDGGQIVVGVLEGIKGSAFSLRTREYILRAGLTVVLLLFALVTYNDLRRLLVSFVQRLG
ncbi:MAG: M50 family metallopeptidase [Gemmatimonadaceae bacterium]|nr:M50 family metallopeptidase [Gemmatimonadaceae bacterium]